MNSFPKEVIKVFEKKSDTKAIISFYERLVDKWHESNSDKTLQEYLGLSDNLFNLYAKDENKFISELEIEYKAFKLKEDINK